MCLAIMAPVRQLICVKEWRKSTNTLGLKCANIFRGYNQSQSNRPVCKLLPVSTTVYLNSMARSYSKTLKPISAYTQKLDADLVLKIFKKISISLQCPYKGRTVRLV